MRRTSILHRKPRSRRDRVLFRLDAALESGRRRWHRLLPSTAASALPTPGRRTCSSSSGKAWATRIAVWSRRPGAGIHICATTASRA